MSESARTIDPQSLENSIRMLRLYLREEDIAPLLDAMDALSQDPRNETLIERLSEAFGDLGILLSDIRSMNRNESSSSCLALPGISLLSARDRYPPARRKHNFRSCT